LLTDFTFTKPYTEPLVLRAYL